MLDGLVATRPRLNAAAKAARRSTMTSKNTTTISGSSELEAQRAYIERKLADGFDFNLMVADAFVRGIRDLGYRSTATALDELIDNSNQAGATKVAIAFAY